MTDQPQASALAGQLVLSGEAEVIRNGVAVPVEGEPQPVDEPKEQESSDGDR